MKKLVFIVVMFLSLILFAEETNWIPQSGWVTGPGSVDNKYTYLLPFAYCADEDCSQKYIDEHPLLYETDMGWPIPNEDETQLKYMFFGDTKFFTKDATVNGNIMSKITDGNTTLLDFGVSSSAVEIAKQQYAFSPQGGKYLRSILYHMYATCLQLNSCFTEEGVDEYCKKDCFDEIANKNQQHGTCLHNCLDAYPEAEVYCKSYCRDKLLNKTNYSECFSYCNASEPLENESDIFDYMDFNLSAQTDICKNFCLFDMVETYASAGYFLYNFNDHPMIDGRTYNNGTSNIFLAAALDDSVGTGNETRYKMQFQTNTGETGHSGIFPWQESAQLYSQIEGDPRRSKSIWMNSYERNLAGMIGIYPRGYFYACAGNPNDGCQTKKLFVPYAVGGWNFLNPNIFCQNAFKKPHIAIPGYEVTELKFEAGDELKNELERQKESLGIGIYDFENECRVRFSKDPEIPNPFFPYSFPSCDSPGIDNGCYKNPAYPNRNILWPNLSRLSNMTVIHGIERDLLSINDNKEYIYFMGTGETDVYTDHFDINCWKEYNQYGEIGYYGEANPHQGYAPDDLMKQTQKTYIARVQAYESEIECAASYEYFAGITNGIARWTKDMDEAEPLYGFYPLQSMVAESIVKHRDLYWMTAPLNETGDSALVENKKGFVVLASPDAFHWQKVDTILLDKPDSIWVDYAFFWLPPNLIKSGDNTMPFLYSVWKANETNDMRNFVATSLFDENSDLRVTLTNFLDSEWDPKFTHYNLKSGKYKFMEENITRAFMADNAEYGYIFLNTIAGDTPKDAKDFPVFHFVPGEIPLPFKTFQNLDNLYNTGWTTGKISEEKGKLRNRYVIIEYCYCEEQEGDNCTKVETGNCQPYQEFVTENGNGKNRWKIIDIKDGQFFEDHVRSCPGWQEGDPDYMCNIPFEHGEHFPKGQRSIPIWNWRKQIAADYPGWDGDSAKVVLRFSHWRDLPFVHDNYHYTEINKQLMENNKLVPFDCTEALAETDDDELPDEDELDDADEFSDADADAEENLIAKTCKDPSSWRISKQLTLTYKSFFDLVVDPHIDFDLGLEPIRLEYLYPYPVMIHDFGKPGDPAPEIWDMLVADHFAREFFKVSSFEYADSSLRTLTSGAAATAVIKNGQMQIYAWGGTASLIPRSTSLAGILYVGTYNPETEVVTFMSEILDETDPNSPVMTAGASMVYDDENDKIYLVGAVDQNGISRIYRLEDARTGRKWESVATIELGRYFRLVKKSEREYFAFGGQTGETSFNTKVYLLDLNNMTSPRLITNIQAGGLANSFAAYSEMDQKLYIFGGLDSNGASDRFLSFDTKTTTWSEINVSGGPGAGYGGVILVDYITETISLGGGVFENSKDGQFKWIFKPKDMTWTKELKSGSYCLKESETALQGGIETSGECVPFTHLWYNSFSAGASVYSLDGKGERLYVGTNNAIKVYDISDPTSPVLVSSFSTSSRVNDLEVYGDALFAATNGGLYKFDASNDTLTQTLFVSTFLNSQYKVEVYDGKLYVGDDNGIKVRDLETLSVLTSVNNGSVLDFAIENGEIGLYKDALFSPVEIRDAETLTLKANEFFGCFEIEVGSSDGRFYLSCDDETYRFEDDGDGGISFTELSGDIRELQDVYTFDGYTYFYDENTIWISTSNDVPAICGNGIVEGDEVCDGGQIDCEELDSNYVSGTATCNSTCDGYNTNNCSDDGW